MESRPEAAAGTAASPISVLIVDDEPGVLAVLDLALRQAGFQVFQATSGNEAIQMFLAHHAAIGGAIVDVRMPGLDGPQTLKALRRINPHLTCCFMTGDVGSYSAEELQEFGAACIIPKPFQLMGVVELLHQLLGVPQLVPEGNSASATLPPGHAERRKSPRRGGNPIEVWMLDARHPTTPFRALIVNRSQGGLCLSVAIAAEAGTVLTVRPVTMPETDQWAQLEVKYHLPGKDSWSVGCAFVQTPPWDLCVFG